MRQALDACRAGDGRRLADLDRRKLELLQQMQDMHDEQYREVLRAHIKALRGTLESAK